LKETRAILGIDAAWTSNNPSGVALVCNHGNSWECVGIAPSYDLFIRLAEGREVDWNTEKIYGTAPDLYQLCKAATKLLGGRRVNLIVVDMPVAKVQIFKGRKADQAISKMFSGKKCGAFTPKKDWPGAIEEAFSSQCLKLGYQIASAETSVGSTDCLVETYPHPALLALLNMSCRVPYKAGKTTTYWKEEPKKEHRRKNLLCVYNKILKALQCHIAEIPLNLPVASNIHHFTQLKRFEDILDALVCAWVGIEYFNGNAKPYGDHTAAIWVPQ
jgi:predicted RNase H-like nuclease